MRDSAGDSTSHHPTRGGRQDVEGTKTELVVTPFSDRIFVVVTQMGKLGTLVRAAAGAWAHMGSRRAAAQMSAARDEEAGDSETFSVQTLMGRRDEELLEVFARRLVQQAWCGTVCLTPGGGSPRGAGHPAMTLRAALTAPSAHSAAALWGKRGRC